MMKKLLTLTLLFFFFHFGFSQNERVIINGKITFLDTPINNVHIHNLTTSYGITSSNNGEFEIMVKVNDILKISHLEYQSKKIIITDEHLKQRTLSIELKLKTNYLNTVEIKNHTLTGNLVTDLQNVPKDTIPKINFTMEGLMELAKMPINEGIRNTEKPPMNNVDPVKNFGAMLFSTNIPLRDKENDLRRELRSKKSFPDKLISEFGEGIFTNELKIPKDKIHHFITYCGYRNINKSYKQNKIMRLIDVLTEESVEYIKIN